MDFILLAGCLGVLSIVLYCVYTTMPNRTGAVQHGTVRLNRRV